MSEDYRRLTRRHSTHTRQRPTRRLWMDDVVNPIDGCCDAFHILFRHVDGPLMECCDRVGCLSMAVRQTTRLAVRQCTSTEFEQPSTAIWNSVEQLTCFPDHLVRQRFNQITFDVPKKSCGNPIQLDTTSKTHSITYHFRPAPPLSTFATESCCSIKLLSLTSLKRHLSSFQLPIADRYSAP